MGEQDIVERLRDPDYAGCMQHLRSYDDIDRLLNAAADLIESLRSDLSEQKNAHRECIKRNIIMAGELARITEDAEPCDECKKGFMRHASGGGIKCDSCPNWFCY